MDSIINSVVWHSDPGHAWLEVPRQLLGEFKPSRYSYQKGDRVYLEEDCDVLGWLQATGREPQCLDGVVDIHTYRDSAIRTYERC